MARNLAFRICTYVSGLLLLAFGVAVSVNSGLGVSPVNSLPFVISLVSGIGLGTCVTLVFSLYVLGQILLLRKKFRVIDLTQIVFSTVFGYFVDFAKLIVGDWVIPTYMGRLLMLVISIVMIAMGISLYVGARLINMPMEGLTGAIVSMRKGSSFHQMKMIVDVAVVALAAGISIVFLGELQGVREGTILCALLVGPVMKPMTRLLNRFFKKVDEV